MIKLKHILNENLKKKISEINALVENLDTPIGTIERAFVINPNGKLYIVGYHGHALLNPENSVYKHKLLRDFKWDDDTLELESETGSYHLYAWMYKNKFIRGGKSYDTYWVSLSQDASPDAKMCVLKLMKEKSLQTIKVDYVKVLLNEKGIPDDYDREKDYTDYTSDEFIEEFL